MGDELRTETLILTVLSKTLPTQEPIWINVDKNVAPKAIDEVKAEKELPLSVELRQNKHLNNRIEQDHRFIKRLTLAKNGISLVQYSGREH